jgi:hypothetical protein
LGPAPVCGCYRPQHVVADRCLSTKLVEEVNAGYDKIIGLNASDVAVAGSPHQARFGGEGPARTPPTGIAHCIQRRRAPPGAEEKLREEMRA